MLASHNLYVKRENYAIIEELEARGYNCLGRSEGLAGCVFYFVQDRHCLMPIDERVNTYTISVKQSVPKHISADKVIYSIHPAKGWSLDCDLRGQFS